MLRKIIDCESFKNSQENVLVEVYFCKVANLQCTDCTSTINRLHHQFFSENVPKNSCLNDTHRENLCFTELSTKIHRNTRLAVSDVFHMFAQSIKFF